MAFELSTHQKQSFIWIAVAVAFIVFLSLLGSVLTPFIAAATLAYILNPWVDKLSAIRIKKKRLPRAASSALVVIFLIFMILAIFLVMIPIFQKEIPLLKQQLPMLLDKFNTVISPNLQKIGIHTQIDSAGIKELLTDQLQNTNEDFIKKVIASIKSGSATVISILGNMLLIPLVLFYFLLDWPNFTGRVRKFIPRSWLDKSLTWFREVDELLAQYLRGQLMLMTVLAFYYATSLYFAGFELALPLGFLTGMLIFIPFLGFGLGLMLTLMSALLQFGDVKGLLYVALIFGAGQLIESFFLTPKLIGEKIGLHPLVVIFSLMAFGQLFGLIGVLIALPATAVIFVALKHVKHAYFNSEFYRKN